MTHGASSVIAGVICVVTILLIILFALQMNSGSKTWWVLILPVIYGVLAMIRMAFVEIFAGSHFWLLYDPVDFINGLTYLCGGNLILIFLALKMTHRVKLILIAASALHMSITIGYLVYYYITYGYAYFGYEYLHDIPWVALFGSVCIAFAFVLMIRESKENRYFKRCIWTTVAFVTGYALTILISYFANHGLFTKIIEPFNAIGDLDLYPLNSVLYLLILLLIAVMSMDECITEMAKRRLNISATELTSNMKTEFLGNMSHELKTPLTSVSVLGKQSYSIMDKDRKPDNADLDEIRDNLRIIVADSDRMKRIIDGLLNVAAIEQKEFTLQKEYFILPDLVREIGGMQFKSINTNENILKFNFATDLPSIYADRERIRDVLFNLISNAARHTKNGTIVVAAKQDRKSFYISVSDNGEGIPEEIQKNLFRRFLEADTGRAYGTGLGLYICKQVVDLHGGNIKIESKPGAGTTVNIELPVKGPKL